MDLIETIKMIMGNSEKFFNSVKKEDIGPSIKYLLLLLIIPSVIIILLFSVFFGIIVNFLAFVPELESVPVYFISLLGPLIGIFIGGTFYISYFIGSFISAAILHVIIYLMGAKKGFENTYKAIAYGSTPSILFAWFPFVNIAFGLWSWYLIVKGMSKLQNVTMERAFIATLVPFICVLGIIALLWAFFAIASVSTSGFMDPSMFFVD